MPYGPDPDEADAQAWAEMSGELPGEGEGTELPVSAPDVDGSVTSTPAGGAPTVVARPPWWRRFGGWLATLSAVRMFAEDKPLLVGFVVLWVSAMVPMFVTPIMPLIDMGSNIGAAGLMNDVLLTKGVVAQHYFLNPRIVPYWTVYSFMSLVELLAGPFVSVKVTVGLALGLLPFGVMRLMRAFHRSPRLGLCAFMLCWDINLYWGWITFQIGMAMALWTLAMVFEVRTRRDALKVLPWSVAIALTHVHAVALLLVVGGLFVFIKRPILGALINHAIALGGSFVLLLPWLWDRFFPGSSHGTPQGLQFVTHPVSQKLGSLFHYTIDLIPGESGDILSWAFMLLLLGPALFMLRRARLIPQSNRAAAALFLLGAAGLYFAVPFEMSGAVSHWWTYPRFGTYALIGLMLLPRPRLDGLWGLAVLPGVLCAFLVHRAVQRQFRDYGEYVRPYLEIIDALPRNQLIYPLDLDDFRFKGTHEAVLGQLHGYAAAAKSGFDPHLFDDPSNPLRFRSKDRPPIPYWYNQAGFTMEREGQGYDYIILHPKSRDIIAGHARWRSQVELVKESGPWRLYKVKH
jgi:hypothetical protein